MALPRSRPMSAAGAALVTLAILGAALAVPAPARAAEDGRALIAKGDYEGAAKAFLAAVQKDPADVEARRGAAEALLGLGRAEEAQRQAEDGLDIEGHGNDAGLWLLLARAFMAKGDASPDWHPDTKLLYADAVAKAAMALRHDPALNAARPVQARALRMRGSPGELEEADRLLQKALEVNAKDFDALFESGELALKIRRYDDAVAMFGRAAEADPKSAPALIRLGLSHAYLKAWDAAIDAFRRAAVVETGSARALDYIGTYTRSEPARRLALYRSVVKDAPRSPWAHAYLAWSLALDGKDANAAAKSAADAVALAPGNGAIHGWVGGIYAALDRQEDARRWWKKALELDPAVKSAWDALREYATFTGNKTPMEERAAWIDFLVKVRPDDALLWNDAGLVYRDIAKDYKKSLQCYLRSYELSPDDQGIVNDTGLMYQFYGKSFGEDPMKALPYYEQVLRLVEQDGQEPLMGYRDTLENLAVFHGPAGEAAHKPDPALALKYGEMRNDPEFLARLPKDIAMPSPRAAAAVAWAKKQLGK